MKTYLRRVVTGLTTIFLLNLLTACGPSGDSWKEQVQLSDGTVITVQRTIKGEGNFQAGYADFKTATDEVKVLSQGIDAPPVWSDKWFPIILDKDANGEWFMVVTQTYVYDEWKNSCPYRQYKVKNGRWELVEFDKSLAKRRSNLTWNIQIGSMPEWIPLSDKPYKKKEDRSGLSYRKVRTDLFKKCN